MTPRWCFLQLSRDHPSDLVPLFGSELLTYTTTQERAVRFRMGEREGGFNGDQKYGTKQCVLGIFSSGGFVWGVHLSLATVGT